MNDRCRARRRAAIATRRRRRFGVNRDGHVILYQSEAKSVSERDRFDARRTAPRKFSHSADTTPASKWMANCGSPDEIRNARTDRKSVVWGKSVSVRVDHGGRRFIKKKIRERKVK